MTTTADHASAVAPPEGTASAVNRISRSPAVMESVNLNNNNPEEGTAIQVLVAKCGGDEPIVASIHSSSSSAMVDSRFVLPKCELPERDDLEKVEMFISKAVKEQHFQTGEFQEPVKEYRGIIDGLRSNKDLPLLRKVMIALRTSALTYLATNSSKHAQLIHLIVRFVPFPRTTMTTVFQIRNENAVGMPPGAQEEKEEEPDFSLADAHLNLVTALVSANSLFVIPAMTTLWKMLTFQMVDAHPER